jgi:tRNA pseudouridine13 synthase
LQSALFNEILARRMARGALLRVFAGDVLVKVESGAPFVCTEPAVDQQRLEAWEVSVSGPIFGPEMRRASGEPGAWEEEVLAAAGLTLEDFRKVGRLAEGTRRPLRVPVRDAETFAEAGALTLAFTLPPGAYATVLIDEVVKPG